MRTRIYAYSNPCVTKLRKFLREAEKQVPSTTRALPNFASSSGKRRNKFLQLAEKRRNTRKMVNVRTV
jgi:hypothetical protein